MLHCTRVVGMIMKKGNNKKKTNKYVMASVDLHERPPRLCRPRRCHYAARILPLPTVAAMSFGCMQQPMPFGGWLHFCGSYVSCLAHAYLELITAPSLGSTSQKSSVRCGSRLPWAPGCRPSVERVRKWLCFSSPKAQNSPKALHTMVFGPKDLKM